MTKRAFIALTGLAALLATTLSGVADIAVRLKTDIVVENRYVTFGDIFENAGNFAERAVFQAPAPGQSGTVRSDRIEEAAREHGLFWQNDGSVSLIKVTRASTLLTLEDISKAIELAVRDQIGLTDAALLTVTLQHGIRPVHLPIGFVGEIEVTRLDYRIETGQFRAELAASDTTGSRPLLAVRGSAVETLRLPVLSREIRRGENITRGDIVFAEFPRHRIKGNIVQERIAIVGKAAKRTLGAGRPLTDQDIEEPRLVRRNELVTMVFKTPGMLLTARGRALSDGSAGQLIQVMNTQSNRIIEGNVRPDGTIAVMAAAQRLSNATAATHVASVNTQ